MNNDFNKYKRRDYSQLRKDYDSLRRVSTDSLDVTPEQLNDPVFGDYYRQYVDTINKLKERENSLLRNAAIAQDTAIANAEENVATLTAENERKAGELRQGREELEALARQRARAMGGMPGSAYEEIQARSERELLKTLANMSADYNNRLISIERDLANRINALESDLMDKLAQIEADKTMTLRERDKAINQLKLEMMRRAEEEARAAQARAAAERARLADMAFYNDLVQQAQQQTQQQRGVKGATTQSTQPQERYSVTIGAGQESATSGAKQGVPLFDVGYRFPTSYVPPTSTDMSRSLPYSISTSSERPDLKNYRGNTSVPDGRPIYEVYKELEEQERNKNRVENDWYTNFIEWLKSFGK